VCFPKPLLSPSYRLSNPGTLSAATDRRRLIPRTPLRKPVWAAPTGSFFDVRRIDERALVAGGDGSRRRHVRRTVRPLTLPSLPSEYGLLRQA